MKTIGLLGGMSWNSTLDYYRIINEGIARELGGLHSAKLLMYSFDFAEIERMQADGNWTEAAKVLSSAAKVIKEAGADFLVLATNTMHKLAEQVESSSGLPLLHIADVIGDAITSKGLRRVGLLGTRFTMSEDFYRQRLTEKFGISVLVPEAAEQEKVNNIIYDELCKGGVQGSSCLACQLVIENLENRGAEGIVLACTELPLLVKQSEVTMPVFDTLSLHAEAAVVRALSG